MAQNAIRATMCLYLLCAPFVTAAQDVAVYKLPPPRVACTAASGVVDESGKVVEGSLRKRCDALWNQSLQNGGVGHWVYDDFMSQCAQSCAAPKPLSQASSVPELNTLGGQAAQSAAGAGGFNTAFLVGGGVAAAVLIGIAVSSSSGSKDQPASP